HNQQVVRYYNLCDIFVLPSVSSTQEGFGLVALEAMACRRPVIVTNIVGVAKEVKVNNLGVVVEPKNVEQLSKALEDLFLDKNKLKDMGANAYNLVKDKYTWVRHVDIVEGEYLKAVG
ncbi:MAG: glycosyltransferase family 4 protein, partial [Deltaproteobacteria bacterium]|nr:glycosyltransferase family 4 protein [Deltaproteobacteria bacterium]